MKYLGSDIEKRYQDNIFIDYCGAEIELYFKGDRHIKVLENHLNKINNKTKRKDFIKEQIETNPYTRYVKGLVVDLGFTLKNSKITENNDNELIIELSDRYKAIELELSSKKERKKLDKLIENKWSINFQVCSFDYTLEDGTFRYDEDQNLISVSVDRKTIQH